MAEKQTLRHVAPGIPLEGKALTEHLKAFSDMDECFIYIDKQQSSLLTKPKKCGTIKATKRTKETVCENYTNIRKKPTKK